MSKYMSSIVMGILPDSSSAETAINNLIEAGYVERNISLVMQNEKKARSIINDFGPLKGSNAGVLDQNLERLGLSKGSRESYETSLHNGKALIAITVGDTSISATKEMLMDYNASQIYVV